MTRVFVLCTGRCGSTTFAEACAHITNYTAGHETRAGRITGRLDYPDQHIEVDNRLAWFLGGLDARYGDEPLYVHLTRDPAKVAASYSRRFFTRKGHPAGLMHGFAFGIIRSRGFAKDKHKSALARLFVQTTRENIDHFLDARHRVLTIPIEDPHPGFDEMWDMIGATGDRAAAHRELDMVHNAGRRGGGR